MLIIYASKVLRRYGSESRAIEKRYEKKERREEKGEKRGRD